MASGLFPANVQHWHLHLCDKCGYVKSKPCSYRGHRSRPATTEEVLGGCSAGASLQEQRRAWWRDSKRKARIRPPAKPCANPECESPFTPKRAGQLYCDDRCRDRAKYLRRRKAEA